MTRGQFIGLRSGLEHGLGERKVSLDQSGRGVARASLRGGAAFKVSRLMA